MSYKNTGNFDSLNDGLIMPFDDSPLDSEQVGENVYIDILNQARNYVYIFTPFLIISEKMIFALKMAAKRGVDVRIITPEKPESKIVHRLPRSYYAYLLQSGIKIFEYTPGFMHAKNFVSDDEIAVVGTINLDFRSLYLHFECATLLFKSNSVKDIKNDALDTFAVSREIFLSDIPNRIWNNFIDVLLRLLAPVM
jgi:cardiolipin synthase